MLKKILFFIFGLVISLNLQAQLQTIGSGGNGGSGGVIVTTSTNSSYGSISTVIDYFARPADTTAYSANDAIAAATNDTSSLVLRSLGVARSAGGSGYITKLRIWMNQTNVTARLRMHLYNTSAPPGVVAGDNYPMTITFTNLASRVAYMDEPAMFNGAGAAAGQTQSNASIAQNITDRIPFKCLAGDTNLYYRIETLDAFTPASGTIFGIGVTVDQN